MSDMNDLVYNPLTGMFERRSGATPPNPNLEGQPTWNPPTAPRPADTCHYTPPPVINTFRRRGNPIVGQKCKFFWSVTGATNLHVSGLGEVPAENNGECEVMMTSNYQQVTLRASNSSGYTTRTLNVYPKGDINNVPLPVINYFHKTGDGAMVGDEVILEWEVTGAKDVYIDGPRTMHVEHRGTTHVNIERPARTYKIRALNVVNKEVCQEVVVDADGTRIPEPAINNLSYEALSDPLFVGDEIQLNWSVAKAETLTLSVANDQLPDIPLIGSRRFKLTAPSNKFTLSATNYPHFKTESMTVEARMLPEIKAFSTDSTVCKDGDTITISWETANAEAVTLNGMEQDLTGSRQLVMHGGSSEIELVARSAGRGVKKSLIVRAVDDPMPKIISFDYPADQRRRKGDEILLSWEVQNAERVELQFGKKTEVHPASGSHWFKIKREKCKVRLVAYNGNYSASSELIIEQQKTFFQKLFG